MKKLITATAIMAFMAVHAGTARAQECATFESGEILCDDGEYAYYWSPDASEWRVLDRGATMAALGLATDGASDGGGGAGDGGSVAYGSDGSLTSTGDGCTMFSSPGYGYGESLSFSSGC